VGVTTARSGDLSRRVAHRRQELGPDAGGCRTPRRHGSRLLAAAAGSTVSFEVDHIDEAMSEGWSVLITGRAQFVDDPAELHRLAQLGVDPWPGGRREAAMRVETAAISGRVIRQNEST
jgi:hypothetical protein